MWRVYEQNKTADYLLSENVSLFIFADENFSYNYSTGLILQYAMDGIKVISLSKFQVICTSYGQLKKHWNLA